MTNETLSAAELGFDGFVDLIRTRMGDADALEPSRLHSFKEDLVPDVTDVPTTWYHDAFEELEAQGQLHRASTITNGFDACGQLSADGRLYLRTVND